MHWSTSTKSLAAALLDPVRGVIERGLAGSDLALGAATDADEPARPSRRPVWAADPAAHAAPLRSPPVAPESSHRDSLTRVQTRVDHTRAGTDTSSATPDASHARSSTATSRPGMQSSASTRSGRDDVTATSNTPGRAPADPSHPPTAMHPTIERTHADPRTSMHHTHADPRTSTSHIIAAHTHASSSDTRTHATSHDTRTHADPTTSTSHDERTHATSTSHDTRTHATSTSHDTRTRAPSTSHDPRTHAPSHHLLAHTTPSTSSAPDVLAPQVPAREQDATVQVHPIPGPHTPPERQPRRADHEAASQVTAGLQPVLTSAAALTTAALGTEGEPRIANHFAIQVQLGARVGAVDPDALEAALLAMLREAARRHGLEIG